jgi:hypothetical protein
VATKSSKAKKMAPKRDKEPAAKKMSGSPTQTTPPKQSSKPNITYVYRKDAFNKVKIA